MLSVTTTPRGPVPHHAGDSHRALHHGCWSPYWSGNEKRAHDRGLQVPAASCAVRGAEGAREIKAQAPFETSPNVAPRIVQDFSFCN